MRFLMKKWKNIFISIRFDELLNVTKRMANSPTTSICHEISQIMLRNKGQKDRLSLVNILGFKGRYWCTMKSYMNFIE